MESWGRGGFLTDLRFFRAWPPSFRSCNAKWGGVTIHSSEGVSQFTIGKMVSPRRTGSGAAAHLSELIASLGTRSRVPAAARCVWFAAAVDTRSILSARHCVAVASFDKAPSVEREARPASTDRHADAQGKRNLPGGMSTAKELLESIVWRGGCHLPRKLESSTAPSRGTVSRPRSCVVHSDSSTNSCRTPQSRGV